MLFQSFTGVGWGPGAGDAMLVWRAQHWVRVLASKPQQIVVKNTVPQACSGLPTCLLVLEQRSSAWLGGPSRGFCHSTSGEELTSGGSAWCPIPVPWPRKQAQGPGAVRTHTLPNCLPALSARAQPVAHTERRAAPVSEQMPLHVSSSQRPHQ